MNNSKFTLRGLLLLTALIALFFGAWRVNIRKRPVTIAETNQIQVGMWKSQVNWRLGGPSSVFKNTAAEYWGFDYAEKQAPPNTRFYDKFNRGILIKVEQSTKVGGPLTLEELSAPIR